MRGRCRADFEPEALPACAVCPFPTVRWAVRSLLALKLSVLARRYAFNGFEFAQKVRNIIIADLQHQVADGAVGMNKQTLEFMNRLYDMIDFLLPLYGKEGKAQLIIAIGCTGGKHRSVAITEALAAHIRKNGYRTVTIHRDITKYNVILS